MQWFNERDQELVLKISIQYTKMKNKVPQSSG